MQKLFLTGAVALLLASAPASAAYLTIDDSNPGTYTLTAGGFNGFSVDGAIVVNSALQTGLVFADGLDHYFSATLLGAIVPIAVNAYVEFALPSAPTELTSYLAYTYSSDITINGAVATLSGSFGGAGDFPYFGAGPGALPQDGRTVTIPLAGVDLTFVSESPLCPNPARWRCLASRPPHWPRRGGAPSNAPLEKN